MEQPQESLFAERNKESLFAFKTSIRAPGQVLKIS